MYGDYDCSCSYFCPSYGIKGPVYLRNRDGLVAYVEEPGRVEWVTGHITDTPLGAMVSTATGMQLYHLLDHVTVGPNSWEGWNFVAYVQLHIQKYYNHVAMCKVILF